ncbi:MAG TPA: hypothetical protein VHH88_04840 [Verrucomicrobiae bacterium]|nr:hypothetical protein [Verrucomicrobiae bacterium]
MQTYSHPVNNSVFFRRPIGGANMLARHFPIQRWRGERTRERALPPDRIERASQAQGV